MGFSVQMLNILIASPSDVQQERSIAEHTIQDWNAIHSQARSLALLPRLWETSARPEMGKPAQAAINGQFATKADLLVGIFGVRVGTATAEYPSGTVEEIKRHVQAGKPAMVYFSNAALPRDYDRAQYEALEKFRAECQSLGLYWSFDTAEDFGRIFRRHLDMEMNEHRFSGSAIKPQSPLKPELTQEAKQLLRTAAEADGELLYQETIEGDHIYAGGTVELTTDRTPRALSRWREGLDQLTKAELVDRRSDALFALTAAGFREADKISSEAPVRVEVDLVGPANNQVIIAAASSLVEIGRLDYLTSDGSCVASQKVSARGREASIPVLNENKVVIWNSPRPDKNASDHSGPGKLRLRVEIRGRVQEVVIPVSMRPEYINNTHYLLFSGSALAELS